MRRIFLLLILSAAAWAQSGAPVRYIVQLTGEPAIKARDRAARRAAAEGEHQQFVRGMRAAMRDARAVAYTATAVNAVIVEAPGGQLAALASLPGVKRVEPVRDLELHLERALHTHEAPVTWALSGGLENAGKGIKIAILDTGIDPSHPAFNAPDLPMAPGFPQVSSEENRPLTNNKIIVARSFDSPSALDTYGHGTAVAMIAAGVVHHAPRGVVGGLAPAAWIGAYRVNRVGTTSIPTDFALQAINAALNDNMDVINMSFGSVGLAGARDDILAEAARNAADSGVIVVASSGNSGPTIMTVDDTASHPKVLAVGASQNSRVITNPSVLPPDGASMPAGYSTNAAEAAPVSGQLVDVAALDGSGLACNPLPQDSLAGFVPLILRGECNFTVKLRNAAQAGALGAIVYNSDAAEDPEALLYMDVDADPTIPALSVSRSNGLRLKQGLAENEDYYVVLRFFASDNNPYQLAAFSSIGPSVDLNIKPDLVATGQSVYTATQRVNDTSALFSSSGYITISGTSFSAPMVAGAAAVMRAARPGLSSAGYRSLLVHSAQPLHGSDNFALPVQTVGAGLLNLNRALHATVTAEPLSLTFGASGSTVDMWRQVILRNISGETATYELSLETSSSTRPLLTESRITLGPGEIAGPLLIFSGGGLAPGAYEGFLRVQDTNTGALARIPYWLAVRSNEPATITTPIRPTQGLPGTTQTVFVRVHDAAGVPIAGLEPSAEVLSGGGSVLSVAPSGLYPDVWLVRLRLSLEFGPNQFRIYAGEASTSFTISSSF